MGNINLQRTCEILSETFMLLKQDVFSGLFNSYLMYHKIALKTIPHNPPPPATHTHIHLICFQKTILISHYLEIKKNSGTETYIIL